MKFVTFYEMAPDAREGQMGIFQTREAAEEFIKENPLLASGLVATSRIVEWGAAFL